MGERRRAHTGMEIDVYDTQARICRQTHEQRRFDEAFLPVVLVYNTFLLLPFFPSLPALCPVFHPKRFYTLEWGRSTREKEVSEFFFLLARFSNTQLNLTTNNVKFLYLRHIFHTASALTQRSRTQADRFFFSSNHFCFHFGFHWVENYTKLCSRRRHSRWSFYGCVFDGLRLAWTWLAIIVTFSGQAASLSDRRVHCLLGSAL